MSQESLFQTLTGLEETRADSPFPLAVILSL